MADVKALTPRATDFSAWYNELIARAELATADRAIRQRAIGERLGEQ